MNVIISKIQINERHNSKGVSQAFETFAAVGKGQSHEKMKKFNYVRIGQFDQNLYHFRKKFKTIVGLCTKTKTLTKNCFFFVSAT